MSIAYNKGIGMHYHLCPYGTFHEHLDFAFILKNCIKNVTLAIVKEVIHI
jgi:hypothetical protein